MHFYTPTAKLSLFGILLHIDHRTVACSGLSFLLTTHTLVFSFEAVEKYDLSFSVVRKDLIMFILVLLHTYEFNLRSSAAFAHAAVSVTVCLYMTLVLRS